MTAEIYASAARALGENTATRLDVAFAIKKDAVGNLEWTIKLIMEVLARHELNDTGTALRNKGGPGVSNANKTPRIWIEGQVELCSICLGRARVAVDTCGKTASSVVPSYEWRIAEWRESPQGRPLRSGLLQACLNLQASRSQPF